MNFSEKLIINKNRLKQTDTTVTLPDGRKLLENHGRTTALPPAPYGFIIDTKPDNTPAKITNNIYLGSQDCTELDILQKFDIHQVLSIGIEPFHQDPGITYKYIPCLDLPETDIVHMIKSECFDFLKKAQLANKNILVHCNAGVSRSPAVVIGYLMLVDNLDYDQAYGTVKKVRCNARPNMGFEKQLRHMALRRAP